MFRPDLRFLSIVVTSQQCVLGKFTVNDNLPAQLAQGMFAKPGTYDMIMRYSSLTPKIVPDNIPAPRGIGSTQSPPFLPFLPSFHLLPNHHPPDPSLTSPLFLPTVKVFGISGEKIWGEDHKTQDWTFNNYPILELRDPQTTYDIADSLERNWNDLATFAKEQGERVDADVATMGSGLPRQHSEFFSLCC